jgi:hypothetical protein
MFLSRAERRRRRWRRKLFFLLAALLTLLAWSAAHANGGHRTTVSGAPSVPASSRPITVNEHPSAGPTRKAQPALAWASYHGIGLPVSPHDGPRHLQGGLAWGFTDTERGALLAAVNIAVRTAALWGPAIYQPTISQQVTGPDAAALLTADTRDYTAMRAAAHVPAGQPAGRGYAAEIGYRFLAYSPAAATVDIVSEGPAADATTVMAATRIQVLWQGGDWRVIAPPGGNWGNSATSISSLTGYTTFPNGS